MKKERLCKLVAEILKNQSNVQFQKLKTLLLKFGFECRQPKGGSSHFIFRKSGLRTNISVPFKKPVGKIYVKQVIKILCLEEWYEENCE